MKRYTFRLKKDTPFKNSMLCTMIDREKWLKFLLTSNYSLEVKGENEDQKNYDRAKAYVVYYRTNKELNYLKEAYKIFENLANKGFKDSLEIVKELKQDMNQADYIYARSCLVNYRKSKNINYLQTAIQIFNDLANEKFKDSNVFLNNSQLEMNQAKYDNAKKYIDNYNQSTDIHYLESAIILLEDLASNNFKDSKQILQEIKDEDIYQINYDIAKKYLVQYKSRKKIKYLETSLQIFKSLSYKNYKDARKIVDELEKRIPLEKFAQKTKRQIIYWCAFLFICLLLIAFIFAI